MLKNVDSYHIIVFILSILLISVIYSIWIFSFIKQLNMKLIKLIKLLRIITHTLLILQFYALITLLNSLSSPLLTTEVIGKYIVDTSDKKSDWQLIRSDNGLVKVKKDTSSVGIHIEIYIDTVGKKYYVLQGGKRISSIYGRVLAEEGDTKFDILYKEVLDRKSREKDELNKIVKTFVCHLCFMFLTVFGISKIYLRDYKDEEKPYTHVVDKLRRYL